MERAPVAPVGVAWPWCFLAGLRLAAGGVFDRDVARRSQGQESAAGLVRTALCTPEGDFRQTRSLTRVETSIRLSVCDRNRLQRRALNLGAANHGVDHRVPHSNCIRRRKIPKSNKLRPRPMPEQGRSLMAHYNYAMAD